MPKFEMQFINEWLKRMRKKRALSLSCRCEEWFEIGAITPRWIRERNDTFYEEDKLVFIAFEF